MVDHADYLPGETPAAHKLTHQDGGGDEISVAGLSGTTEELAAHILLPTVHQDAPALIEAHRLAAAAHHAKYTNAEAVTAMGALGDGNPLNHDKAEEWGATEHTAIGDAAPHHAKYTDGEAVTAMGALGDANPLNHDKAEEWGAAEHTLIGDGAPHHAKYTDALARASINDIFGSDGKADADIDLDSHALKTPNIVFPATQVPSANVNTLDDYQEGTWTPSVGGSATYTSQIGTYIKIGSLVFVVGQLTINLIGTGSVRIISGLPFTSLNTAGTQNPFPVSFFANLAASVIYLVGYNGPATATIYFNIQNSNDPNMAVNQAVIGDGAVLYFSGFYRTV